MTMPIAMPMRRLRSLVAWLDESTGSARARPPPSSAAFREPHKARTYQHGRRASAPDEGGRLLSQDVIGTRDPSLTRYCHAGRMDNAWWKISSGSQRALTRWRRA